jgi:hypothetical protein
VIRWRRRKRTYAKFWNANKNPICKEYFAHFHNKGEKFSWHKVQKQYFGLTKRIGG